jgi:glycosyltransferase involved in cell wall biosynthesis
MSSLTVMFLTDYLKHMGGAERNLYVLAKGLRDRGHEVIICCLQGGALSKKMQHEGFYVENFDLTKTYDFEGLKAILKMMKIATQRVSVIVSYHDSSDYLGLLIAILARVPIVSSRRDMGFKLKRRHIWLYRSMNRFFDCIATVSFAVKQVVVKTQWANPSSIIVIPNGVHSFSDINSHSDRLSDIELDTGCLNICCLGNIRSIKGQKDLVDAADLVARHFPSARFFLAGKCDVDKSYYADIQRRVREFGLEKIVKFTGEIAPSHIPSVLASMDISVLPSLSEGMSNTLLESMSAGKPVVATAVGGNPELVEDGKTGYLVPPGDPHSMAEALLRLLANPQLRHEMGLRGKYRAESLFSVKKMVERYDNLLQDVCMTRGHRWQNLLFRHTRGVLQNPNHNDKSKFSYN